MSSNTKNIPWKRLMAEGAVIVFSISLAFFVDAWWDSSKTHSKEQAYLSQLRSDLKFTLQNNSRFSARAEKIDRVEAQLARVYYASVPPSPDSVAKWLSMIGYWVVQPRLGTVKALISTGDLALIRNDSLRNAIPIYLTYMETFDEFEDEGTRQYQAAVLSLEEHVDIHRIQMELLSPEERNIEAKQFPLSATPEGEMRDLPKVDLLSVVRNPNVHRALIQMSEAKSMMQNYRGLMKVQTEKLLDLVSSVQVR